MPLVNCEACGRKISTAAAICPACGHPNSEPPHRTDDGSGPTSKGAGGSTSRGVISGAVIMCGVLVASYFVFPYIRNYATSFRGEKVDLRGPAPRPGDMLHKSARFEADLADAKVSITHATEEEITVDSVDGRSVTKFRTKYTKNTRTKNLPGRKHEEDEALAGSTVLSEKIGDRWRHSLANSGGNQKQKDALAEEQGWDDQEDIPAGKQAVGCVWDEKASSLMKLLGPSSSILSASGSIRNTFVRIEQYQGERCAVIEGKGQVTFKTDSGTMTLDVSTTTYRSLESGYDLKEAHDGQMLQKTKEGVEVKTHVRYDGKTELRR